MAVATTTIEGLAVITMKQVADERGVVREFYRASSWTEAGLPSLGPWQQMNVTESKRGAVRGLHGEDMFKLVAVAAGEAFGAYVDTRAGSSTFGAVATVRPDGRDAGARAPRRLQRVPVARPTPSTSTPSTPSGSRAWRGRR